MKDIIVKTGRPYLRDEATVIPEIDKAEFESRIAALRSWMDLENVDVAVVYGDREHFSNIFYLCGYDPRFEEALFIVPKSGKCTIVVGNEGYDYSFITPLDIEHVLYQNFSLQGQPRDKLILLEEILAGAGIEGGNKVGVVGFKYFLADHIKNPKKQFDIPAYILSAIAAVAGGLKNLVSFTYAMTDHDAGVRMSFSPKQIAIFEYAATQSSNRVVRMLEALDVGKTELEVSAAAGFDGFPLSVFPNINFGAANLAIGLRSPNYTKLVEGDPVTISAALRGSLVCRSGLALRGEQSLKGDYAGMIDSYYKPYYRAIATWLESVKVGARAGDVYKNVMELVGDPKFGIALNPGHNIGEDEWTNSPFFLDSPLELKSGQYYQCDIIMSVKGPVGNGIVEDGYVLADAELRARIKAEYPDMWMRMQRRRDFMINTLGIEVDESVLPMSNCAGICWPYMLKSDEFFAFA